MKAATAKKGIKKKVRLRFVSMRYLVLRSRALPRSPQHCKSACRAHISLPSLCDAELVPDSLAAPPSHGHTATAIGYATTSRANTAILSAGEFRE